MRAFRIAKCVPRAYARPHTLSVVARFSIAVDDSLVQALTAENQRVTDLFKAGDFRAARPHAERAVELARETFTELEGLHPAVASTLNNLGAICKAMGSLDAAGKAYQEATDIYHLVYSPEHKSTLTSSHNLALLFKAKGELGPAEDLCRAVLKKRREDATPETQNIAVSLAALGSICHAGAKYTEAEECLQEAMEIHKERGTENSVAAAAVLSDFALLRRDQGQTSNAMQIAETAVGLRLQLLGVKHPDFAASVYNLRTIYELAGAGEKASALDELLEKYDWSEP